jgi:hypothetical protein
MDFSSASFGLSLTGALGLASFIVFRIVKHGLKSKCMVSGMSISLDVHQSTTPPPELEQTKEEKSNELKVQTEQVVLQVLEHQAKSNTTTPTINKNKNSVEIV